MADSHASAWADAHVGVMNGRTIAEETLVLVERLRALQEKNETLELNERGSRRLAEEAARLIHSGRVSSRSPLGDALLDWADERKIGLSELVEEAAEDEWVATQIRRQADAG